MPLEFRTFRPSPALAHCVHCYWTLAGPGDAEPQVIFPDGRMELVFQMGDAFRRGSEVQARRLLVGQMRRYVIITPGEQVQTFGIRFRPGGAFPLFRFPQGEVEDQIVALDDVDPALSGELSRAMDEAQDPVAAVERALLKRISQSPMNPAVCMALGGILRTSGQTTIGALAADSGVTKRHLERVFRDQVGVPPKVFARIVRFQRVLKAAPANWAAIAAESGYFDQAHLVRDFQQFTGETPAVWAARRVAFLQDGGVGSG
jgi:AraC-like DNA-binding protein